MLQKRNGDRAAALRSGPGLEYNFLFFNLNDLGGEESADDIAKKQAWFQDLQFRQAVSAAIDREGIVRLVYDGRATPYVETVGRETSLWADSAIPHPARSLEHCAAAVESPRDFPGTRTGSCLIPRAPVEFSIITSSSNTQRMKMATMIQDDLSASSA